MQIKLCIGTVQVEERLAVNYFAKKLHNSCLKLASQGCIQNPSK